MKNSAIIKSLVFILLYFNGLNAFAQNESLFEEGKESYKNGNFQEARAAWNKILENGEHSGAIYFNLANAHYKLNNIGESIYYYEKALQLSPNDSDIKNNLAFAENARIDAIEPLPKTIFSKWYSTVSGVFTFNGWALLSVVFAIIFATLFLVYYFSFSEKRKRLLFSGSLLSVLIVVVSFTMAFLTYADFKNNTPAIVFAEEIEIKSEPNMGSTSAFLLHEGTKVQIISKEGDWARIKLEDGKDGWMPLSGLKQL